MKNKMRIIITSAVILAAVLIVVIKSRSPQNQADETASSVSTVNNIPTLLDLGSKTCIPCKMMAPILEELRSEYYGRMRVIYYDVREEPEHARTYGIRVIPTIIFINEHEEELYRHEGFISKQNILDVWKELGYDFEEPSS